MRHPKLMPGTEVRDGDFAGRVIGRLTTRDLSGNPHREITVEYVDGRTAVYVNDEIYALEAL